MQYKKTKIKLHGHEFWYLPKDPNSPNGPIAPLHHCDENGELDPFTMFSGETYAHVQDDGTINRYGIPVGKIDNLLVSLGNPNRIKR